MRTKLIYVFCLLCCSLKLSAFEIEVQQEKVSSFSKITIDNAFGFVSAYYERILSNFNLLNTCNKDELIKSCNLVLMSCSEGKKVQFIIKKYDGVNDLIFIFTRIEKSPIDNILCISNYDSKLKKIINNKDDKDNAWAIMLHIKNGHAFDYKAVETALDSGNPVKYANEMLFDKNIENDALIKDIIVKSIAEKPTAFAYVVLAQQYYLQNDPDNGIKILRDNIDSIFSLTTQDKFRDIYDCVIEEGKAIRSILNNLTTAST